MGIQLTDILFVKWTDLYPMQSIKLIWHSVILADWQSKKKKKKKKAQQALQYPLTYKNMPCPIVVHNPQNCTSICNWLQITTTMCGIDINWYGTSISLDLSPILLRRGHFSFVWNGERIFLQQRNLASKVLLSSLVDVVSWCELCSPMQCW